MDSFSSFKIGGKIMDRQIANKILKAYHEPVMKLSNGVRIQFARETIKDIEQIEKMSDIELIDNWKGLCYVNHVYGCVSIGDLERLNFLELEMDSRPTCVSRKEELKKWFDDAMKAGEEIEQEEISFYDLEERLQIGL
jgi:hypothetical protein